MILNLSFEGWGGFSCAEMRTKVTSRDMKAGKHKSQIVNREVYCVVVLSGSSELRSYSAMSLISEAKENEEFLDDVEANKL